MPEPQPINLISTEELIEELLNRFEHGCFIARNDPLADRAEEEFHYRGDYHICMGLCGDLAHKIYMDREDELNEAD